MDYTIMHYHYHRISVRIMGIREFSFQVQNSIADRDQLTFIVVGVHVMLR